VSYFHVLRSRTRFRRYRGRRVSFSCFVLPDLFLAVPRASGPVFMLCAPGLVFDGTEVVGSRFYVLRSRTCFSRYRGHQVQFLCFPRYFWQYRGSRLPFSCFALLESFSAVLCDPFSRAPHRLPMVLAMRCGRRTRRSLLSVHLFNAG
jgi:hypothetical protein